MKKRPFGVKIFGLLSILWGACGLVGLLALGELTRRMGGSVVFHPGIMLRVGASLVFLVNGIGLLMLQS